MAKSITVNNQHFKYDKNPTLCPICHHSIEPVVLGGTLSGPITKVGTYLDVGFHCTHSNCKRMFIGRYKKTSSSPMTGEATGDFKNFESVPVTYKKPTIFPEVSEISSGFESVFTQAAAAESHQLNEIAGVGYRKALEFLIKDYCIHKRPDEEEKIKSIFLSNVINDFVDDANIKACARRASWLGNDETHYVKKWEGKDIQDLKILIELTCGWVRNNILTEKYMEEMT